MVIRTVNTKGPGNPNYFSPSPPRLSPGSVSEVHFAGKEESSCPFNTIKIPPRPRTENVFY